MNIMRWLKVLSWRRPASTSPEVAEAIRVAYAEIENARQAVRAVARIADEDAKAASALFEKRG